LIEDDIDRLVQTEFVLELQISGMKINL